METKDAELTKNIDKEKSQKDSSTAQKKKRAKNHNKELGRKGEDAAARFLYKRGYDILERNWKCFAGEADIIVKDANVLVFVEVKTRSDTSRGFPAESVTLSKRDKYEKIALAYVSDHELGEMIVRFDVVSVVVCGPDRAMLKHYINAFSLD